MTKLAHKVLLDHRLLSLVVAILLCTWVIELAGSSLLPVAQSFWMGAFGTPAQVGRVFATWMPLVLCSCGLVYTFTTGLYNLGIEGQITAGAVASMMVLRALDGILPAPMVIGLALGGGLAGGGLWGGLAGGLYIYGRISEIFAGLGLNFVMQGLVLYLIFGPWGRPGVASMSGTEMLDRSLWLPMVNQISPISVILALGILIVTGWLIRQTLFGLQLQAVGKNLQAARILGIPATARLMASFGLCGGIAGLAGSLQVLAVFHRLIPSISSNLGFLALLVVMLVRFNPLWILPVAFFFSALNVGSLQLPLSLQLESSLAGVIQGALVLCVLLGQGWQQAQHQARSS
ncbi:MAG: ABC transporter permease [Synechococcaceae cyanobacterium SM2_3_2]|nr:ABC transporter permease [Synechococcaceae cyanobacterium SM2_3_2]